MDHIDRYLDVCYEDRMFGADLPAPATLRRWLVARGQVLAAGTALAIIGDGDREFVVRVRFPCVVDDLIANEGERLYH